MIHDIFINGFKDDIIKLKSKIRMKMLSRGYMGEDQDFIYRFDELWSLYSKYNFLNVDKKDLINVIYTTTKNPNPLLYLSLINFLFGTLKDYYDYEIDNRYIKDISQKSSYLITLTRHPKPFGVIYFKELVSDLYEGRYYLTRKVDKNHYEIKCIICNHEWKIPQYYISCKMVKCPICK